MAIFPYVLYDLPVPKTVQNNIDSPIDFFIKVWGETNDENFAQSLPGKIISTKEAA